MNGDTFQKIGQLIDGDIAKAALWYGQQPETERIGVALLAAAFVGLFVGLFVRWVLRGLWRAFVFVIQLFFGRNETGKTLVPTPPADHFHDPKARYGVMRRGHALKMVPLPGQLKPREGEAWDWALFNVTWEQAAGYIVARQRDQDCRSTILAPPAVLTRKANEDEDEVIPAAELVLVVQLKDGAFHVLPATETVGDNATHEGATVIGNAMLPSLAEGLVKESQKA